MLKAVLEKFPITPGEWYPDNFQAGQAKVRRFIIIQVKDSKK
jgi:hypothetical protein